MESKRKRRLARLYTDVKRNRFWRVAFTDAKKRVEVPISFSENLTVESKRGVPFECVLARGIEDAAITGPALFPHNVKHVYVLKRTIYIVDRVNGMPVHAVRYFHEFGYLAKTFDLITKDQFIKKYGGHGFTLGLRPAKKRGGKELTGARETRVRKPYGTPYVSRGALGRAQAAGFEIAYK